MTRFATLYFGWYIVGACFLLAIFAWGFGFYGQGVYLAELQRSRGWSASLISTATTTYYLISALLIIFTGDLITRFGPRRTILPGVIAFALGAIGLATVAAPWQLYPAYLLVAAGWATTSSTAITTTLVPWFERRRGLAISLALTGASFGGIIVTPVLVALTGRTGFTQAVIIVVAVMVAILSPLIMITLRHGPAERVRLGGADRTDRDREGQSTHPESRGPWTRGRALRSLRFWSIVAPFALGLLAQVGFLTHQIAFLTSNLGRAQVGAAVGLTTAMAVVGRLGLGLVVDRQNPRLMTAVLLASQAVALVILAIRRDAPALYSMCLLFGLSVGNLITLPSLIVQREYDAASFGTLIALVTAICQFTYAFGPGLVGIVRDRTGGYGAPLLLCAACEVLGAMIILAGGWLVPGACGPVSTPTRQGRLIDAR